MQLFLPPDGMFRIEKTIHNARLKKQRQKEFNKGECCKMFARSVFAHE